jgi:6-pyruvoyltetrahydropterin/6-carboxytetrahydropterin synthase
MSYEVEKHYGHDLGLSCVYRQWRADSHCSMLHGYSLAFTLTFSAAVLDKNGWVIDFGSMKPLKSWLCAMFDHTLLVASEDPAYDVLMRLNIDKIADARWLEEVGCEAFAEITAKAAMSLLDFDKGRVWLKSVRCAEHSGNSATWIA